MLGYSKVGKSGRGGWFILRPPFSLEIAPWYTFSHQWETMARYCRSERDEKKYPNSDTKNRTWVIHTARRTLR
jgi:hypothetical protein